MSVFQKDKCIDMMLKLYIYIRIFGEKIWVDLRKRQITFFLSKILVSNKKTLFTEEFINYKINLLLNYYHFWIFIQLLQDCPILKRMQHMDLFFVHILFIFLLNYFFCSPICFSNKPVLIFLLKFIIYHIKQLFFQTKKIQKQNDNSVW